MTRKFFIAMALVGCISVVNANGSSLEQEIEKENQENQLENNFIKSSMLANKAMRVGKETIDSLKANLVFIQRLESDPEFRKCVVLKVNLKKLDKLAIGAKKLFDKRDVTEKDYKNYISELNSEKENLEKKIDSKQCSEEG